MYFSLYSWSLLVVVVTSRFPLPCVHICLLCYFLSCINHLSVLYISTLLFVCYARSCIADNYIHHLLYTHYTYIIIVFDVNINLAACKIFHYAVLASFNCIVHGSPLMERKEQIFTLWTLLLLLC